MNNDKKYFSDVCASHPMHYGKFGQLKKNMQSIYQEKGEKWIADLPAIVDLVREHWKLIHVIPVENMTYHFVAKAEMESHQKVVLKIGLDKKSIENEKKTLLFFNGKGSVKLLDFYEEYHAMLLDQIIPGYSLKSIYPAQFDFVIETYCKTMQKLHSRKLPYYHSFPHVHSWLAAIDHVSKDKLPQILIEKAIDLKNKLLSTLSNEKLLHGDLHHDNIIQDKNEWIIIDPKGVVGEVEFEAAAFDFMHIDELANYKEAKEIMHSRIERLAKKAHLDPQRLMDWVYVRLILMAVWSVEDNGDPTSPINLASFLYNTASKNQAPRW